MRVDIPRDAPRSAQPGNRIMVDNGPFKHDVAGANNARILGRKEVRSDFSRVEAAGLARTTNLYSPEAKRLFARSFTSLAINAYYIGTIARARIKTDHVAKIEDSLREQIAAVQAEVNKRIDETAELMKRNGLDTVASYASAPMAVDVKITSSIVRRYFELIHKVDQVMPMIDTLELEEVITSSEQNLTKRRLVREVRTIASSALKIVIGMRKRIAEHDANAEAEVTQGEDDGKSRSAKSRRPAIIGMELPDDAAKGSDKRLTIAAGAEVAAAQHVPTTGETIVEAEIDEGAAASTLMAK